MPNKPQKFRREFVVTIEGTSRASREDGPLTLGVLRHVLERAVAAMDSYYMGTSVTVGERMLEEVEGDAVAT